MKIILSALLLVFSLQSYLLFYSPSAAKCASSSSFSSPILLQGTMHPISSSLVKHTQCAALIPFYNQDTWLCYGDVTFLMHHLRWLAWNASSQGYVVSCRHNGLIQKKKEKPFHVLKVLGLPCSFTPMSQNSALPWEGSGEQ